MRTLALAFFLASVVGSAAIAGPAQNSEDIVKFFAGQAQLGTNRAICVGTEDECNGKAVKPVAAVAAAPAPAPAGLDMLVNFDLNSAELTPDAKSKLTQFSTALRDNRLSALNFVVEGYTDASGPSQYNVGLSERRARSVMSFLLDSGVQPTRLSAVGLGATNPRVANPYDPVNRRVEMRIKVQ
jgi:outer membrane protein OmpA-like peptidoglycan-associated protein